MKKFVQSTPTHDNWEQFCSEPSLSDDEVKTLSEMRAAAWRDKTLASFLIEQTRDLQDALDEVVPTLNWSDMVEWADRNRRLQRAEIAAYREWCNGKEV